MSANWPIGATGRLDNWTTGQSSGWQFDEAGLSEHDADVRSRALAEATKAAEGAIADTTEARWTRDRIVDRLAALAAVTGEPVIGNALCHYCETSSVVVVNGRPACGAHIERVMDDTLGPVMEAVRDADA